LRPFFLQKNKKMASNIYNNWEYIEACKDKNFWDLFYYLINNRGLGYFATYTNDRQAARYAIVETILVYRLLKDKHPLTFEEEYKKITKVAVEECYQKHLDEEFEEVRKDLKFWDRFDTLIQQPISDSKEETIELYYQLFDKTDEYLSEYNNKYMNNLMEERNRKQKLMYEKEMRQLDYEYYNRQKEIKNKYFFY
jgi:hypothetical protein